MGKGSNGEIYGEQHEVVCIHTHADKSHLILWLLGMPFKIKHHFDLSLPFPSNLIFHNPANPKPSQFRQYFNHKTELLGSNFAFLFCYCSFVLIP